MPLSQSYYDRRLADLKQYEGLSKGIYLDGYGLPTVGIGVLLLNKTLSGTVPTRHIGNLASLTKLGCQLTVEQSAVLDAVAAAIGGLPANKPLSKYGNLSSFLKGDLGKALSENLKFQRGVGGSFLVSAVKLANTWVPVPEVLDTAQAEKFVNNSDVTKLVELKIDKLAAANGLTLTEDQRLGLFSVGYNLPRLLNSAIPALKAALSDGDISYEEALNAISRRGPQPDRLRHEAELISGDAPPGAPTHKAGFEGILDWITPSKELAELLTDLIPVSAAVAATRRDPLALDLDGDGAISTIGLVPGAIQFDMADDGFAEATGWVGPNDGLVVRDIDGNGLVDSGRELFGDETVLSSGAQATNGFLAIAELDSNADGQVDALDEAWPELLVWRDANSDGVTDAGELITLAQAGVSSINTSYSNATQEDASGNIIGQLGTFERLDGGVGKAVSFLFDSNTVDSSSIDEEEVPPSVKDLPNLDGFGKVLSLHQEMASRPALIATVENLVAATDYQSLRAQFEALIHDWTGASTVAPTSRGPNIDARQLTVLENFYGQVFVSVSGSSPNANAAIALKDGYTKLIDGMYAQYLAQAQLKPVWDRSQTSAEPFSQCSPCLVRSLLLLFNYSTILPKV